MTLTFSYGEEHFFPTQKGFFTLKPKKEHFLETAFDLCRAKPYLLLEKVSLLDVKDFNWKCHKSSGLHICPLLKEYRESLGICPGIYIFA